MTTQPHDQATGIRIAADYLAALPPDRSLADASVYLHELADAMERVAIKVDRVGDNQYVAVFVDEAAASSVDQVIRQNIRHPAKENPRG